MKIRTTAMAAAAAAAAGAIGIAGASFASADEGAATTSQSLGSQAKIVNGTNVQGWTVTDLKQSSDTIPYQPHGTLWEATATDEAIQGGATPIVSNFNAVSPSGQTYRVLYQVATPQGVNPAGLAQGQKTSGKIYFDVTGDNPNSIVYTDGGGNQLASWVQSSQPQGRTGGGRATSSPAGNSNSPAQTGTPGTATPAGNPAAPAATGSQGTPIPAGSQGTPPAAGGAATTPAVSPTAPGAAGTPAAPAGPAAPAPGAAGSPAAPAQGAAGAPAAPAPANSPEAPATSGSPETAPGGQPAGSQGTPTSAGTQEAPGTAGSPDTTAGSPASPTPGASQATPAGSQGGSGR
ncbi:MPT63 family protein [Mycobacterium kyorinense]|uniref:MPT63 family protein n=2 Tax=Mycobacterium kyorinense TaxID=487514 RepID=UPI000B240BB4